MQKNSDRQRNKKCREIYIKYKALLISALIYLVCLCEKEITFLCLVPAHPLPLLHVGSPLLLAMSYPSPFMDISSCSSDRIGQPRQLTHYKPVIYISENKGMAMANFVLIKKRQYIKKIYFLIFKPEAVSSVQAEITIRLQ